MLKYYIMIVTASLAVKSQPILTTPLVTVTLEAMPPPPIDTIYPPPAT